MYPTLWRTVYNYKIKSLAVRLCIRRRMFSAKENMQLHYIHPQMNLYRIVIVKRALPNTAVADREGYLVYLFASAVSILTIIIVYVIIIIRTIIIKKFMFAMYWVCVHCKRTQFERLRVRTQCKRVSCLQVTNCYLHLYAFESRPCIQIDTNTVKAG